MSLAETGSWSIAERHADMRLIPGGTFHMGSDQHYREEKPVHRVSVDSFWIDRTPVTDRQFQEFVEAMAHVTFAEIAPDAKDYPGAFPRILKAGSPVFGPPDHSIDLCNFVNRGGLNQAEFAWGDALTPGGRHIAKKIPQEDCFYE